MSIESFATRVLRFLSIALFLVALFATYTSLPDQVAVHFDPTGKPDGFLGRETIFYSAGGLMFLFNVLTLLLARSVNNLPDAAVGIFGTAAWRMAPGALRTTLTAWFDLGLTFVNVVLAMSLNALSELNDAQTNETVFQYRYILLIGAGMLLVWFLYLPLRLILTRPPRPLED